jgi:disulfide bond formation protein DsbB
MGPADRHDGLGWLLAAFVLCVGALAAALISQHGFDMQPCPWCVLQRLVFVAIALAALIGLAWRRTGAALMLLLAVGGMAAALWQHFVAAASESCNLTWPDRLMAALKLDSLLPEVFQARASCAEGAVNLFGLPYEFWSLGLFALLAFAALRVMRSARRPGPAYRRTPG